MALADSYATPAEYRNHPDISKTSLADDVILGWCLEAISRVIDAKTNQPYGFNKDDSVTTRIYAGDDRFAPIASTTGLVVKASAASAPIDWDDVDAMVLDTDFELLPRNALTGPLPKPYTDIKLLGWGVTPVSQFQPKTYMPSVYRVRVTAIHGWPSVPQQIKWATIVLTAMLGGESIYTTGRINELDAAVDASPQARALLRDLWRTLNPLPVAVA